MEMTAQLSNLQEQVARLEALVLMLGQAQGISPMELKRRTEEYMDESLGLNEFPVRASSDELQPAIVRAILQQQL